MENGTLIELFTSPTCPYCPQAREMAEKIVNKMSNVLLIERDISEPENANSAKEYGIMGVPTMVVNGKYIISGVPEDETELMHYIRRA